MNSGDVQLQMEFFFITKLTCFARVNEIIDTEVSVFIGGSADVTASFYQLAGWHHF